MCKINLINKHGKEVLEVKNCKTIRGARTKLQKTSFAFKKGWKIRIEVSFRIGKRHESR